MRFMRGLKLTRREFVRTTAIGAAGLLAYKASLRNAYAFYQSPRIPLFKTRLRGVGPGGIPVALADPTPAPVTGVTHYTIGIQQFQDQITPPAARMFPTTFWGFVPTIGLGGNVTPTHLGGIIVAHREAGPIQITFRNQLFSNIVYRHIIPVDTTIPGANQAINRTATHLHGGLVPWISDGGPFDWWNPDGLHGASFLNNQTLNPGAADNEAEYYYPLNQSARFMWYHDHAVGITRLNAYAGIASAMLIRDSFEASLINAGLPNYIEAGGNEIPLVFQDKIFVGNDINQKDKLWNNIVAHVATSPGSLWYAHTYEPNQNSGIGRWDLGAGGLTLPDPSSIPEFFGDTMLVNGTVFPEARVEARRYRLRLLNACNARFLNLQLYVDDGSPNGITLDRSGIPTNMPFIWRNSSDAQLSGKAAYLQIGTEGGFLARPALIPSNIPFQLPPGQPDPVTGSVDPSKVQKSLIVAPAERPDLLIDFSGYAGQSLILYSDAPAPFPSGDDRNDYFPGWNVGSGLFGVGNPVNGTTQAGYGPNTRVLMRFKVVAATGSDAPLKINTSTDLTKGIDPLFVRPGRANVPGNIPRRFKSLNEYFDAYGRLVQILGNEAAPLGSPYFGYAAYIDGPGNGKNVGATAENVSAGSTEIWEVFNTTGDTHPMHFHLVNVQIINRQVVNVTSGPPYLPTGPVIPPEPNETGWKETVPMYPGTVTRVIMKFDLSQAQIKTAAGVVIPTPASPRTGGVEYVWHCHILEHEEHDMMHALVVT